MPPKKASPKCKAKTKATGAPCRNEAGERTDHPGKGRCWLHGGASPGGKPKNKNALKTGLYETIHTSALAPEEAALYSSLDTAEVLQAENTLRLLSIREHRILLRLRAVELSEETSEDGMALVSRSDSIGFDKGKNWSKQADYETHLATVMRLEEALTRVQNSKAKAIDQLMKARKANPSDSGGLEAMTEVFLRSAANIARRAPRTPHNPTGGE